MRGLVMLFVTLALSQKLIASEFPDGIPESNIPKMRTGFSLQHSNSDIFNAACRNIVIARFSENLRNASPEDTAKILNNIQTLIPVSDFATANEESIESLFSRVQHTAIQAIKPKLLPTLRDAVPEELILSSGFVVHEQSPLEMAGCYIRLGKNLRDFGLNNLAASSFLKSGTLFAIAALQNTSESRVDFLLSAAQCYYWSYCNEESSPRTEFFKSLASQYFENATAAAQLLPEAKKITWIYSIERENAKFLNRLG